jgi:hypothetical protein
LARSVWIPQELHYLVHRDGTKVVLGTTFERACLLWAEEKRSLVKLARPTTALRLLADFESCSLPLTGVRAATRRSNEMRMLRSYFLERDDPNLDMIKGEADFLSW